MAYKFDKKIICPRDPSATPERIAQYRDYYKIKYDIIKEINPKSMVEIGVRAGYSAYFFCQAIPELKYYGYDAENNTHGGQGGPWLWWAEKILESFDTTILSIDTQTLFTIKSADFYHIDGDHSVKGAQHDLDICYANKNPKGTLLIDDYDYIPEVREGVDTWLEKHPKAIWRYKESLRGEIIIT